MLTRSRWTNCLTQYSYVVEKILTHDFQLNVSSHGFYHHFRGPDALTISRVTFSCKSNGKDGISLRILPGNPRRI